jgi:hypothetical protein
MSEIKTSISKSNNRQNVNRCIRNLDTNKEREKVIDHSERKVYRRII